MTDRVPGAPGQYSAVIRSEELEKLQNGENFIITLTRDDQPITPGTPYSKASVLPDELAAKICPGVEDPQIKDAFAALADKHKCFGSFSDIGITTLPTTMAQVAAKMPSYSVLIFSRSAAENPIEDWGLTTFGAAFIIKGGDAGRVAMMLLETHAGLEESTHFRTFAGAYNAEKNLVKWSNLSDSEDPEYPGCRYRWVGGEKEWINPPMMAGVEYRTAERYNGAVVYCKHISHASTETYGGYGDSPVEVSIPHGISGYDSIVRVDARHQGGHLLPIITSGGGTAAVVGVTTSNIELRFNNCSFAARTWKFNLYYTK